MKFNNYIALLIIAILSSSCGSYFNQPVQQQEARTGEVTPHTEKLKKLPLPKEPVVVGVYNFKDQTGQYKNVELGNSFSTAVSQGGTTMLIKALEDSKWFTPIERENLQNLLNERNIIRSTRKDYQKNNTNGNQPNLPPLLYAGVLLEGGIVSYDTNIITGGMGARYFGVGASTQYREDRLTVYLRAVSTSNGKVLKTIYISKTILSQAVDASLFRYVNFQRLLEVEMGYTKNEPVQLALKDAIEKAVEGLIIEGIQDNLWSAKAGEMTNNLLVKEYLEEKEMEESKLLYNRTQTEKDFSNTISVSLNTPLFHGDFSKKKLGYGASLGYSRKLTNYINFNLLGSYFNFKTGNTFSENFVDLGLSFEGIILPYDNLTPFVYGGLGYLFSAGKSDESLTDFKPSPKIQGGVGIMYVISPMLSLKGFAESNLVFSDTVDFIENGKRDDYFLNFGIGINYSFGRKKIKN